MKADPEVQGVSADEAVQLVAEDRQMRISKAAEEIEAVLKRHHLKLLAITEPGVTSDGTLKVVAAMKLIPE